MNFIDLFCGIGGFHQAMIKYNPKNKCVFASDKDAKCRDTYKDNYGLEPNGDITKVNFNKIPNFDILCGGFPCQPFSNAGKKKSFDDKRGLLFDEIIKIAKLKKPKFMFLENVKHIKKVSNGEVFKYIIDEVRNCGYYINDSTIFELSPHQLGIPQDRKRIIFACIRNDIYNRNKKAVIKFKTTNKIDYDSIFEINKKLTQKYHIGKLEKLFNIWDEIINKIDTGDKLSPTIMTNEFYNKYINDPRTFDNNCIVKINEVDIEFEKLAKWRQDYILKNIPIYKKYKKHWDIWYKKHNDFLKQSKLYYKLEWQVGKKKENDSIFNYFIQMRQSGIRVKKTKYFPTLVAMVQIPIYAKERRYLTPRECARLQSFPESFKIHKTDKIAYKQFGNAVNVDVIYTIIKATLDVYKC
tara:strand:+ start:2950 stop:4179 length:1230 start_codon:yes stop_codon:yes gene_type:complete